MSPERRGGVTYKLLNERERNSCEQQIDFTGWVEQQQAGELKLLLAAAPTHQGS